MYMKGYLHHQKQIAVLSKKLAFPRVRNVRVLTERYNEDGFEEYLAEEARLSSEQPLHDGVSNDSQTMYMSMDT